MIWNNWRIILSGMQIMKRCRKRRIGLHFGSIQRKDGWMVLMEL